MAIWKDVGHELFVNLRRGRLDGRGDDAGDTVGRHVYTNFDRSIYVSRESVKPAALIGKLSIQYEMNFANQKK